MASSWGRFAAVAGQALAAGVAIPACTVAGYFAGRFVGKLAGWPLEASANGGAVLGVVAGFWNLVAILQRFDRAGRQKS